MHHDTPHGEHAGPHLHVSTQTVEELIRSRMSDALGGARGMVEAAVPTALFTVLYLTTKELQLAIVVAVSFSVALLVLRVLQRSAVQFVLNSLFGIGIGVFFVWLAAKRGGDADDQTLAYFAPGILYNAAYAVGFTLSILVRWPVVGFMVGAVAGEPTEWHSDRAVVRLCSHLTWFLALPAALRVAVQAPIYFAGKAASDADWHIAALGVAKLAMGWPLQLLCLAGMVWLLSRNRTPMVSTPQTSPDGSTA